ncbi:hypothetical protein GPJ56_008933 [Histomonas meleagridis]|uniref:uncharacterized protein n=1 Tax=Histomonas meleagridis TaxID=135588 RepID=UPI003559E81D|nr:hypothetical protein GPJ56_008933 [Histomonas meleagridis]KAH0797859.1 hypothetical protein GO595_009488 [Histomonas meleagridis]
MIQAKEKFVPTPSSPRRNPFCDGNGKQFDLFFAESINGFILSHFPISSNYQSYEEYEFDVDVWYTSLVNTLKNNIYQNNLSLFLRRPPINYTEYYGKNQFRIGPLHFKQIEETILLGLPYDKNSIFDEKINKNEVPISQWIIPNCPWNSWSIPQFPDPNFYDNFEDFSKAAKNWYEISSQLIRCKARDFKEIKESTESLPIRTWTDVTNETSKELENFIWHPSSFPYQQYVEKQPIKKPALPPLPPPSPQFTFYYIDNRPINESMISSQINRLLGAYKKGFTLDFEVRVHPLIVEFTNYGCDAFDSTTTIDEKELPPAKLTIFELYQILNLDYDQISYYEKNQVYVTILEILNISRPFSLSSMFLTTYSLYVICRIFIEHLEKPFEIIDPCFGCLRDPTFYPYHTQLFNLYFTRILFKSIRRSLESAFHNGALATVEILKLLSSLIRKLTKDDKFISQQYASNFSAIIKFLKECGLSESKILFTFDVKHGTAESNARRKHAVEQFRRLIEANPTIAKAFEEMSTEFGALSPSKKGQSKRKEFSVRRKKQSNN